MRNTNSKEIAIPYDGSVGKTPFLVTVGAWPILVTVGNCWSVAFWVICLVTVGN